MLAPYTAALRTHGREPAEYVVEQLRRHDLLLFDDALHTAAEPFDLYRRLLDEPDFVALVDVIFLELVPINRQPALDAYLAAAEDDPTVLDPAFQDSTGGTGLPYQTYYDLMAAVRRANRGLPTAERIEVVAVSEPTYWCDVHTPQDVEHFRRGLVGRDHHMYRVILDALDGFESGRKGIFLTNTRHAYKEIRRHDGTPFWNTGTFFHLWHPGRTHSIRFHNVTLFIEGERGEGEGVRTTEGLERLSYRWGRMEDGLWDSAFAALGSRPVAVPLAGTPFGRAPYAGNHMHEAAPGQTMADAYDAVIFLAPLEELHRTAIRGALYTPEFRREVGRRYPLLFPGEALQRRLEAEGAASVDDLTAAMARGEPRRSLALADGLEPADAWKRRP